MSARRTWLKSQSNELRQTARAFTNDESIPASVRSEVRTSLWAAADHVANAVAAFQRWEQGAAPYLITDDITPTGGTPT